MKKEANGKKSLAWLWILIAILAVLAIAGGILGFIFLGGLFGQEDVEPEPEKIMSDLYWNVDRKEMIDPETGLSIREAAADGMYYLRLAVNGEQKEIPVADKKLVNRMDILDVFGLQFDAEGNVVDLISPEDMYTKIGDRVFVQSIEGNTLIVNTSQALNGMQIPVTLTGNEGVFSVSTLDRPEFDGQATQLEIMDQVLIYGSDETTAHTIYVTDRFWHSDVYWRTVRYWDAANQFTSREQQPDGYWYFDMAAGGKIHTFRTNRDDVIKAIDSYAVGASCCGLVFDENGDVIDCFNAAMAARGYVAAGSYDVTELSEDGKTFTATRILTGNEVGKTYTGVIGPDTQVYNVNTTADFVGQATELQLNDRLYVIADTKGNAKYIFVINRMVDSPMYYLLNRSYSDASGMTAVPDADGYYNFTFAVKGKQKKLKTKDKELAEQIHAYGYCMMGLKVSGDKVLHAYNPECVSGNYSFAGNYFVTSFADPLLSTQSVSGVAANGVLAEGCEVYDVSGVNRVKGKKTTIREGDRVICYTNARDEITHVYIVARYVAGNKLYWNINTRAYNGDTFETTATPNEEGYYTFKVIQPGKGEVELKTTSKEVASQFHALATNAPIALKVSGTTLKAAYPGWSVVKGGGYYSLAHTTLTEETEDGGYRALTTTFIYGTLRLGSDCKTYNVAAKGLCNKYRGESTSIKLGDRVYPIYSNQGVAQYVFVTMRERNTEVYYKFVRMYNANTQQTTRVPDADGYYVYKVTVNGKVKEVKTKDVELASQVDSYSLGFGLKLSGNIIKAVYPAESAPEVFADQVSYRDVTKISGKNITTKRNKPGQSDTGAVSEIEKADNCLIVNVSPTAGDNWGKKATLQRGDRIFTYKDNDNKTSIIYIMNECTRSNGGYAKCPECGKTVWWEPYSAGFAPVAGYIPSTAHYYVEGDMKVNTRLAFADSDQVAEKKTMKIVLDLYGNTVTRIGSEGFDAVTGESTGFYASGSLVTVGNGNTLTIINSTKKVGGLKADEGVQFTGPDVLVMADGDVATTENFNETGTLIIKGGIFDASKATSIYKDANTGTIAVGGNLIVKGGEIIGIKSTSTTITANAAAIGTWGGSNVTIEGGIVRGCPVEEGDIAGPGGAAISANSSDGIIKITGGEIIGSHVSGSTGSAIYNGNAQLIITGGTVRGGILSNAAAEIEISGKPVITDEFNGGLTPAGGKINVGTLEPGASIHLNTTGIFTTDFETEEAADAVLATGYFKSGAPIIRLEKALATGEYRCLYGHTTVEQCQAANCKEELTFWKAWTDSESLPNSGNYYLTTDVAVSAAASVSGSLVLDLNGYTITREIFSAASAQAFAVRQNYLRLCDSTETPGKIVAAVNGIDPVITSPEGLISSESPSGDNRATIIIDRITVDGSNLSCGYAGANTGIVVSGGDMIINDATIKGYATNPVGNGTAIGSWGGSTVTINGNSVIIGGNAPSTTVNMGQGGVIAVNGDLIINGGTFSVYEGAGTTKHGGIICMNNGALTINGGTFYGHNITANGAVINSVSRPVTINGGTFYAGRAYNPTGGYGGVLYSSGKAVITGGTFIGYGADTSKQPNYGGLVYSNGAELTITGGTFKNGNDVQGGCNIYYAGTGFLTISGEADIAGEVLVYNQTAVSNLIVGGKALVDFNKADFHKGRNIRINNANVYLNSADGEQLRVAAVGTKNISLTYDCAGNVTGIIDGNVNKADEHEYDNTGKCTKCGQQAEGENRCVNGHANATECAAAGCTAEIKFFRAWEETTSLPTSGAWYLTENVTVSAVTGVATELDLDLNGKTITRKITVSDNTNAFHVAPGAKLHLGDSAAIAGSIVAALEGLENDTVKSTNGLISADTPSGEKRSVVIIDRITIDASTVKDNLYTGTWKTTLTATEQEEQAAGTLGYTPITDANDKILVYLNKDGVPMTSITINAGAVVVGGDLIINGATIKGYQHTQGNGTAIGTWGGGAVTINKDSVIIGGSANAIGSKALFGTETDFDAITNLGQGGVIAMGNGPLTINGGEFKTYEGVSGTKHGGLIMLNGSASAGASLTITDGTFHGAAVTSRGAVIHAAAVPVTISGGTFYAANASAGGILAGADKIEISGGTWSAAEGTAPAVIDGGMIFYYGKALTISGGTFNAVKATNGGILTLQTAANATITGGTFEGVGNDSTKASKNGGLIYNSGTITVTGGTFQNGLSTTSGGLIYNVATMTITGGTFKNGIDTEGGRNIYNAGTLTIGGDAKIAGEVLSWGTGAARAKLIVTGKAVIDSTLSAEGLNRNFNIRLKYADAYLHGATGTPAASTDNPTKVVSLTHDGEGNVNGIV